MTEELRALVNEQAEDEGLWFVALTAPEAYLQQELRRLHAAVESVTEGHLVPESEALASGERDCAAVLAWWQEQVVRAGDRAEEIGDAVADLRRAVTALARLSEPER